MRVERRRKRDVFLSAEKFLPSLERSDADADQLLSLVGELERRGVLRIRRGVKHCWRLESRLRIR